MKIDKVSKMIVARLLVVAHRLISFSFFLSFSTLNLRVFILTLLVRRKS